MALQNKETGELAPSRISSVEKLNQLTETKQRELENSLLKVALMEYSAQYEQLQRELRSTLQAVEKNYENERRRNAEKMKELQWNVLQMQSANELLTKNMSEEIAALTSSVKTETVSAVQIGLNENIAQINNATKKIQDYEKSIFAKMNISLSNFKEKQDRFFEFDSIKSFVFWTGAVLNILTFVLLLYLINK